MHHVLCCDKAHQNIIVHKCTLFVTFHSTQGRLHKQDKTSNYLFSVKPLPVSVEENECGQSCGQHCFIHYVCLLLWLSIYQKIHR